MPDMKHTTWPWITVGDVDGAVCVQLKMQYDGACDTANIYLEPEEALGVALRITSIAYGIMDGAK